MKYMMSKNSLPHVVLALLGLIMLCVTININWGKDHWNQVVRSDGEGYYAYLPAVFIFQDLNFTFFDYYEGVRYHDPFNFRDYRMIVDGVAINKCWSGMALAVSPFYLGAHVVAGIAGYEQDGFSPPYPLSVTLAALFYLLLGLWAVGQVLKSFGVRPWVQALVLPALLFGTNLFYYTVSEPSMTHVYSFGLISLFVLLMRRYFLQPSGRKLLWIGLVGGMIMLIRPLNVLVLLSAPLVAADAGRFLAGLRAAFKAWPILLGALMLAGAVLSVQCWIYYFSTGYFWVYSYGKESFDFLHPNMVPFLFSYKKGFFLYTPLALLALGGLWPLWKQYRFAFYAMLAFLLLLIFIFSSWWSWWYGGSFSSRVMTDYLIFFGLLLGLLLESIKRPLVRGLTLTVILFLVLFCQVQTFQYRYHQIHWADMNREAYWDVFLRVDRL